MAPSVVSGKPQTELNKVPTRMARAGTDRNAPGLDNDALTAIDPERSLPAMAEIARRRAGLKLDYLAYLAGVTKGRLCEAFHNHVPFDLRWMEDWPEEFWDEFMPMLRAEKERSKEAKAERKRERMKSFLNELLDLVDIA